MQLFKDGEPVLHGFTHETTAYTNEYTSLEQKNIQQRIIKGKQILERISEKKVIGFIPPKWILPKNLIKILINENFKYTTSFLQIIPFYDRKILCPAINFLYTYSSFNKILANISAFYGHYRVRKHQLIRITIHPEGFMDRKSILDKLLRNLIDEGYQFTTYSHFLCLNNS